MLCSEVGPHAGDSSKIKENQYYFSKWLTKVFFFSSILQPSMKFNLCSQTLHSVPSSVRRRRGGGHGGCDWMLHRSLRPQPQWWGSRPKPTAAREVSWGPRRAGICRPPSFQGHTHLTHSGCVVNEYKTWVRDNIVDFTFFFCYPYQRHEWLRCP